MSTPLQIVMMGTGSFAVPMFRAVHASRHRVPALMTQPARASRGHRPAAQHPMRQVANELGVTVYDPESINSPASQALLQELRPDLLVVADYGQILSPETLAIARLGGINLHGSLLPKYRGAAPINWAIYHGDAETGVTVIHMTPRVDAGPCLAARRTVIEPLETAVELELRLAELGAPLVVETIERLLAGEASALAQEPALACGARRLRKSDGEVHWSRSSEQIRNQIRALEPWPRTSTSWLRADQPSLRLILGPVVVQNSTGISGTPGRVLRAQGDTLWVATGDGCIALTQLQPTGKRMMNVGDFLRGHPLQTGDMLGPEPKNTPSSP